MAILSGDEKADLPDSALGTPSWSRLGKLEDLLMRLLAQSDSAWGLRSAAIEIATEPTRQRWRDDPLRLVLTVTGFCNPAEIV